MVNIDEFFSAQFRAWPEVAARFNALKSVLTKSVGTYRVQFNPARAVSTAAPVDAASIASRPCFLCAANRPPQQLSLPWEDMEILVNPFPIFPGHLTIAARAHTPQSMLGRIDQMRRLSRELPGYTVFFNGARCGASAPDHMHFQAVPSACMRIPRRFFTYELPPAPFSAEEIDPMVNMVCTDGRITVIPRTRHRPGIYGSLLVSPAAIDLSGTLITVRREDFDRIDAPLLDSILSEVTFSQPPVYVGLIADNPQLTPDPDGNTTTVRGMVIGAGFHWQQRQSQRFEGEILTHGNQLINRIGAEDYLRSVICSEMSAGAPLEFLKAHAVISRSWLMCHLRTGRALAHCGTPSPEVPPEPGEIRRWFDSAEHSGFDVCSDDHCQRYQGVTRISSPNALLAVSSTRGLVLATPSGRICDARFSKCCGGAFEEFATCWQPLSHPYLRGLPDSPRPDSLPDLSLEENARAWILGRPASFCGSLPPQGALTDFDRESSPDCYRWTVRYTQAELSALIARRSGIDFGSVTDLIPLTRGTSGRISRLRVVGTAKSLVIGKELIIRRWLSPSHLFSSAFIVNREGSDFVLHGAGWGHGVGLCQYGAANMAARGYDFRQILAHYYPGSTLRNLY